MEIKQEKPEQSTIRMLPLLDRTGSCGKEKMKRRSKSELKRKKRGVLVVC